MKIEELWTSYFIFYPWQWGLKSHNKPIIIYILLEHLRTSKAVCVIRLYLLRFVKTLMVICVKINTPHIHIKTSVYLQSWFHVL